jgi:hypothetical protein
MIMGVFNRVKAFKRLNDIQDVTKEKNMLEDLLFFSWKDRGNLSHEERVEVMEKVVRRIKEHGSDKVKRGQEQLIREENALDRVKMLSLFGSV